MRHEAAIKSHCPKLEADSHLSMEPLVAAFKELLQDLPSVPCIEDLPIDVPLPALAIAAPSVVVLWHLLPWLYDYYGARGIPGPFLAKFSDLWLGLAAKSGHRSEVVHKLHLKHGPL